MRARSSHALLALVLAGPLANAQERAHDDPIWGQGVLAGPHRAGPRVPDPPPIVPTDWLAIPIAVEREPVELVLPWILDPDRAPPTAGVGGWEPIERARLSGVACAYTTVVVEHDEVRMARLPGARWIVVGDSAHIGDPEGRGDRGVPVALKQGENRVFVVGTTGRWELELWKPPTRCVPAIWDVGWPHTTGNADELDLPVFNASPDSLDHLHVHFGHFFVPTRKHPSLVARWADRGWMAPLSMWRAGVTWWSLHEVQLSPGRVGNKAPVVVYGDEDVEAARVVLSDLDRSYERRRLSPSERERGRAALGARPQARVPGRALLVYGTQGDATTNRALLARARLDQQILWYECGDMPDVVADTQLVEPASGAERWRIRSWASSSSDPVPVVLYGDVASNAAWTPLRMSGAVLEPDARGILRRNEAFYGAQDLDVDAWTLARPPIRGSIQGRSVFAFASRGAAGARLSLALGMLGSTPGLVRIDPASRGGYVVVDAPK